MTAQTNLTLNDGRSIPQVGLGVWRVSNADTEAVVTEAIRAGYRAVDTAALYGNEDAVGRAVAAAPGGRDAIFVTTKVWNDRQGRDETRRSLDESLRRLGADSVDLFLIHWPAPGRGLYVETWRTLVDLKREGRVRSIGVSNFDTDHLRRIIDDSGVVPTVNQVELHPRFQQGALRRFHAEHGILTQSWRPLGKGAFFDDPILGSIAAKHAKTPAQVVIRWHVDSGLLVIPKSQTPSRIRENFDVFDFTLDAADLGAITGMDRPDGRMGSDPATFD